MPKQRRMLTSAHTLPLKSSRIITVGNKTDGLTLLGQVNDITHPVSYQCPLIQQPRLHISRRLMRDLPALRGAQRNLIGAGHVLRGQAKRATQDTKFSGGQLCLSLIHI